MSDIAIESLRRAEKMRAMTRKDKALEVLLALSGNRTSLTRYYRQCQYHVTISRDLSGMAWINYAGTIYLGGLDWYRFASYSQISVHDACKSAETHIDHILDERSKS